MIELSDGNQYEISHGQSVVIDLKSSSTVSIWECIGSDCHWDNGYTLIPGNNYKIIDNPNSSTWDLSLIPE